MVSIVGHSCVVRALQKFLLDRELSWDGGAAVCVFAVPAAVVVAAVNGFLDHSACLIPDHMACHVPVIRWIGRSCGMLVSHVHTQGKTRLSLGSPAMGGDRSGDVYSDSAVSKGAAKDVFAVLILSTAYNLSMKMQGRRNPRATDSVSGVVLLERWSASDPPLYFCVHGTPAPPLPEDTPDETMPHPIQDAPAEMTQSNSPESETSTTGREDASKELQIEELPRPPEKAQAAAGREDESKEPQTPEFPRPSGKAQAA
ncbi:putative transmembrane protein, partial [Toxoplasma gondii VEG]